MTALEIFAVSCMVVLVVAQPPQGRRGGPGGPPGGGPPGPFPSQAQIAQFLSQSGGTGTGTGGTGTSSVAAGTGTTGASSESSGMENMIPWMLLGGVDLNNMGSMALMSNLFRGNRGGGLFGMPGRGLGSLFRNPFGLMGATGALGDNMQQLALMQAMGPMGLMMGNM